MKKALRKIALQYLNASNPVKAAGLLLKVQSMLADYKYAGYRKALNDFGFSYFAGLDSSSKIVKGNKLNYVTRILYLSASDNAGTDLCPFACWGCRLACLVKSGRAGMSQHTAERCIEVSRLIKSWLVIYRKDIAHSLLHWEIAADKKKYENYCVRPNGTSDIEWYELMQEHSDVMFYDYTKDPRRVEMPNYHLTFSYSTMQAARIKHYQQALDRGQSLAVPVIASDVSRALELPETYSMDDTDLRFLDNGGSIGILKAKQTANISEGCKHNFLLDFNGLQKLMSSLEVI